VDPSGFGRADPSGFRQADQSSSAALAPGPPSASATGILAGAAGLTAPAEAREMLQKYLGMLAAAGAAGGAGPVAPPHGVLGPAAASAPTAPPVPSAADPTEMNVAAAARKEPVQEALPRQLEPAPQGQLQQAEGAEHQGHPSPPRQQTQPSPPLQQQLREQQELLQQQLSQLQLAQLQQPPGSQQHTQLQQQRLLLLQQLQRLQQLQQQQLQQQLPRHVAAQQHLDQHRQHQDWPPQLYRPVSGEQVPAPTGPRASLDHQTPSLSAAG
ncbi:unnamed protein product, partial [Prorocentrum cordatum]